MSLATQPPKAGHDWPKSDYKHYPKTLAPDDLWGQVRRTIHGKPVSEAQIAMIVAAIRERLALARGDVLLDLACGNGALGSYLVDDCAAMFGVDFSDYLISVAEQRFALPGRSAFKVQDAASYVESEPDPGRYTKVLCYGSFSFFPADDARTVLATLARRFTSVQRVMLGNLPDRDRVAGFYPAGKDYAAELDDPAAQIGIWRSAAQMRALAEETGWRLEIARMSDDFYAAKYRYDAILHRPA